MKNLQNLKKICKKNIKVHHDLSTREIDQEVNQIFQFSLKLNQTELIKKNSLKQIEINRIEKICKQRCSGLPLAYIFKEWDFYGRKFVVSKSTLIPRPDTELMIDLLKDKFSKKQKIKLLDLGAGTGIIGITSILENNYIDQIVLSDINKNCLKVIKKNLKLHHVKKAKVICSDWFNSIGNMKFNIIVSNPPYIDRNDQHLFKLFHEPKKALVAKNKGFSEIYKIIKNGCMYLEENGVMFIEHGYNQGESVRKIFKDFGFVNIESHKDINGIDRITEGEMIN